MRKVVFNAVIVVSFLTVLGVIYYLGSAVVQSIDPVCPTATPLPFIVP
jgi:hypothetical protein